MSGALALIAGFAGFACLIYAAKAEGGTAYGKGGAKGGSNGLISPGPILGQLLLGNWPYGAAAAASSVPAPAGPTGPTTTTTNTSPGGINL